jgi:Fic family protein
MTFKPDEPYRVPPISKKNLKDIQASLAKEITDAQVAVAQIKGFLEGLPESSSALMNPIFLKEAVESSEIENINTTLLEVLQRQVAPDIQEKSSSQLVVNYLIAMMWGMENVNKLGMTSRLIRGIQHQLLPTGAEGYRRLPVVIGDGKGKVHYSPPNAADIPELIGEWEELVNDNPSIDPLVLAAAAHYQFEAIHPFEDGNGRTGRMIMTLQLVNAGLIDAPVVHISQYINVNKAKYYRLLRSVTSDDQLQEFIKYMLKGFAKQANHSFVLLKRIRQLQRTYKHQIREKFGNIYSHELLEAIFARAVQTPVQLAKDINIHYVTASKYLKVLEGEGYLRVVKLGRHTYYINQLLLELIEEKAPMTTDQEKKQDYKEVEA